MCGIAGHIGHAPDGQLDRMLDRLRHRGPDGEGRWEGEGVALGMTRLAIIDLQAGDQPFQNEDETVVCVFNGEIYNHLDLRRDLEARGHVFRSHHADGEVIVHLYEEHGLEFLDRLDGMFAIALWDRKARSLVLARDRLGIKPLYVTESARAMLAFASEPKALFDLPGLDLSPDPLALHHYLSFKHVPAPMSAFRGIRQLRAGEYLVASERTRSRASWWSPVVPAAEAPVDEREATTQVRALLEAAVRHQSAADVPCGAYLSGGADSSTTTAIMARYLDLPVETFTLVYEEGFDGKDADRRFARAVAERYGTRHTEVLVRASDVTEQIDKVTGAFDEPFSGVISTYFLTKYMGPHVKVALSGDGADEIFGSYLPHRLAQPLAALRAGIDHPEIGALGVRDRQRLATLPANDEAGARLALYLRTDKESGDLLAPGFRAEVGGSPSLSIIRDLYARCADHDPLTRALMVDQMSMLPDQVLAFVDRLSMAHSLEVRPPFLDHTLVEYVNRLPGALKIRRGRVKHILKEAVADLLPADLLNRPKEGFLMPINQWLTGALQEFIMDVLSEDAVRRVSLLDGASVKETLRQHQSGERDHGDRIWSLAMLQTWGQRFA